MKNKIYFKELLRSIRMLLSLMFVMGIFTINSFGQIVVVNPSSPWTVPAGVTSVKVEVWGGGGAGGGSQNTFLTNRFGGGGGGGGYSMTNLTVNGGEVYTFTIGAGGTVPGSNSNGNPGGATTFTGPGGTITAGGGGGGIKSTAATGGAAGIGSTFNGGAGGTGTSNGAGGGGGAGNAAVGSNGANTGTASGGAGSPNIAPYKGGNGGATQTATNGNGNAGLTPGGGGGGGKSNTATSSGGVGAAGQVVLTYFLPAPIISGFGSSNGCVGGSITINGSYFTGATAVSIGGTAAAIVSNNGSQIVATIGSGTTGIVSVTTPSGTATSGSSFIVDASPLANASNNGPICSGNSLNLSSTSSGVTYSWSGPASFSSTLQNPSIPNAATTNGGTYILTVTSTVNGCTASTTTPATVNATPVTTATNNSAICAGSTLNLTGGPSSMATYSWVGPNGYTSASQSPSRTNALTTYSGIYTLTVISSAGCTSSASTTATVNAIPSAAAANDSPGCTNGVLNLNSSGGNTYLWSGPNGFTSTSQNPSITAFSGKHTGDYTVTVTQSGCTATASTTASIKALPVPAPTVSNTSVCPGISVNLTSSANATINNNASFAIPDNNSTGTSSPIVLSGFSPAAAATGTIKSVNFSITHTFDGDLAIFLVAPNNTQILLVNHRGGSSNNFANTTIVNSGGANGNVSAGVAPFTGIYNTETAFSGLNASATNGTWKLKAVDNANQDVGNIIDFTLTLVSNGTTYSWTSSTSGFTSSLQNPSNAPSSTTTYTVGATLSGCTGSGTVIVNTLAQPMPSASSSAPVCAGTSLSFFGDNTASGQATGNTYAWTGPNGFSSSSQNPGIGSASLVQAGSYILTVTNSSGCTSSTTTSVAVNPNPVLSIGSQDNVSCNGLSDGSIDIDASSGTPSYTFDLDGNASLDGIYSDLSAGNYTASVIDDNGCESTPALTVTITQPAVLVASAASNSPACTGTSLNLSASQSGGTAGYGYLWTGPNGFNSTAQNPTINAATQVIAGQYDLQITDANGCVANASHAASVITSPTAAISYNGPGSICLSQSASLQLAFTGSGPWTYVVTGSGGPYSGTTSSNPANVSVTPLSAGDHDYTIATIADANCPLGGTVSGVANVNVITAPPVNTVGTLVPDALQACAGSVMMITVNTVGGQNINYQWNTGTNSSVVLFSTSASGPFSPPPFQTSSPLVYAQFGNLLAGHSGYNVCVQGVNGCGNTNNKCTWIRGVVGVPGTITPAANVVACPNDVKSYSCGISGGASIYNWTLSGSTAPIISGQGTPNVSVAFPSIFTSGQLCVTASLACGGSSTSASRCMTISNNPAIAPAISGPSKVCPGENGVVFSIPLVNGASNYNWTIANGASIVSGAGTNSITVNFPSPYNGANLCVTNLSACGSSAARCKAVGTNIPVQPGFITGPTTNICNSTVQYSIANVSGANSYTWSIPAGTNIISGQGSTTILLNVGSTFTTGQVTVVANTAACTPGTSVPRTILINGKPNTPASITANPGLWCAGGSVNFSVAAVSPLPTYNWVISNGVIDAGQGTNNIDVTWGLSSAGGVSVSASNSCGVSGIRSQSFSSGCREEATLENNQDAGFSIYPNPAHDNVSVSIYAKENANYMIRLTDIAGREMFSDNLSATSGMNKFDLNTTGLAKGVYMMEVKVNNLLMKKKLMIQ